MIIFSYTTALTYIFLLHNSVHVALFNLQKMKKILEGKKKKKWLNECFAFTLFKMLRFLFHMLESFYLSSFSQVLL